VLAQGQIRSFRAPTVPPNEKRLDFHQWKRGVCPVEAGGAEGTRTPNPHTASVAPAGSRQAAGRRDSAAPSVDVFNRTRTHVHEPAGECADRAGF
jgi:hypothetical protein